MNDEKHATPQPAPQSGHQEDIPAGNTRILARCPDCLELGGCILGIPSAFRIEKQGCPATGVCRTHLYEVTSATAANHFKPPVEAFEVKSPGAKTGVRIVNGMSFCHYIRQQRIQSGKGKRKSRPAAKSSSATHNGSATQATPPPAPPAGTTTISTPPASGTDNPVTPPPPPPPPSASNENGGHS